MKELSCVLEDNEIEMDIVCWGGSGNNKIIKIPSPDPLRYDRFKQNLKSNHFIYSLSKTLSDTVEGNISSSLINLCHYIAEYYKDQFVSATSDSGLTLSSLMSTIDITSILNDVGINISQLRILLRLLRHKIGAKLFDPESKMTDLCGEMIVP